MTSSDALRLSTVICLLASLLSSCRSDESSIHWQILFESEALALRAVGFEAQIVSGSCLDTGTEVLYEERFRSDRFPQTTLRSYE